MKSSWQWRQHVLIPSRVLVIAGRTEYTAEGWPLIERIADPATERMLENPNILGMANKLDRENHVIWGVSAWADYQSLSKFVEQQIAWLRDLTEYVAPDIRLRHNAYRILNTDEVPPSWYEVELMVDKVRSASPLGADAFPELSRMMGLQDL